MKTMLLWLIGLAVMSTTVWILFRTSKENTTTELPLNETLEKEKSVPEKPPQEKSSTTEPLTEQQQLIQQLLQQRKELAVLIYRQDCGNLFHNISACLQDLLAQEQRSCSREDLFCRRLTICINNKSLDYRISTRETMQEPKPLSYEEATADATILRAKIIREKSQYSPPMIDIPWDSLMESLLPCLEQLILSAEAGQAEECRHLLAQMQQHLAAHRIFPLWYHEETVQQDPEKRRDFVKGASYSIPALYYRMANRYIHIGAPGCTGEQSE